mmetsp:Transcript_40849/g.95839  ORF Transcript_40849/g.95839 Transcript_40849/m.95839 type:complete len:190 (+) Transcript_40849:1476-2045(+)
MGRERWIVAGWHVCPGCIPSTYIVYGFDHLSYIVHCESHLLMFTLCRHAREAAARSGIEDAKIAMAIRSGFSTKKLTPPTPPQSPVHIVKKPVCKNSLLDANTGTALRRRERALSYPLEEEKNDVEDATPRRRRQSIAEPTDKFKKISSIARRATAFGQRREDQEYVEKKRLPSLEELRSMLQQNLTNQ